MFPIKGLMRRIHSIIVINVGNWSCRVLGSLKSTLGRCLIMVSIDFTSSGTAGLWSLLDVAEFCVSDLSAYPCVRASLLVSPKASRDSGRDLSLRLMELYHVLLHNMKLSLRCNIRLFSSLLIDVTGR